ncbi:hypothetical protein L13192_05534 [Pyrenophora tritici-repentis]|uniref:Uncharacterized protein n=3 Tax=Pyrenophora tritici-repentis TaxID=45151 RepID=A0A317A2E9_9PLEO|nr:uncharacterized protein PTRG_04129 [Pyrenophora tritici-repentis Pt-1C-BFP]KAI0574258.1 hypothetical protein Alg215_08685 [Pyrenophora tritici-repentis]EDU46967.1 predicted protein [Pyrenophora tritici-repentis Pt-1C-BFP]KAI1517444.1 hypothetical protein Ptr86124_004381 [Pyrenophora tritici-repentis]KAI1670018.1 hypothetical protein L13192_05534 [Pyrenophora tritici-repentis]KAI1681616.1 hypothetical protein KJE20_08487 [Pyrenophora tritici-repentis]
MPSEDSRVGILLSVIFGVTGIVIGIVGLIVSMSALRPEGSLGKRFYDCSKRWYKTVRRRLGEMQPDPEEGHVNADDTANEQTPSSPRPRLLVSDVGSSDISNSGTILSAQSHVPKEIAISSETSPLPSVSQPSPTQTIDVSPFEINSSLQSHTREENTAGSEVSLLPSGSEPPLLQPNTLCTVGQLLKMQSLDRSPTLKEDSAISQTVLSTPSAEASIPQSDVQTTAISILEKSSQSNTPDIPRITLDNGFETRIGTRNKIELCALPQPSETETGHLQNPAAEQLGGRVAGNNI